MQAGRSFKIYVESVGILTALTIGMFLLRVLITHTLRYWFIPENLALAWASLFFAWWLTRRLKTSRWRSWQNLLLSICWLLFLPNTWYVMTDFIHVYPTGEINELYDIVLIASLIFSGFTLGLTSLYIIHNEFVRRMNARRAYLWAEVAILLSSFAIYLGRDLRWSTWDVITNPGGLILNVSDRILDPLSHTDTLSITALMFVSLSVIYFAFRRGLQLFRRP